MNVRDGCFYQYARAWWFVPHIIKIFSYWYLLQPGVACRMDSFGVGCDKDVLTRTLEKRMISFSFIICRNPVVARLQLWVLFLVCSLKVASIIFVIGLLCWSCNCFCTSRQSRFWHVHSTFLFYRWWTHWHKHVSRSWQHMESMWEPSLFRTDL